MDFRVIDTETSGPSSTPPDVACEVASVDYNSETGQFLSPRTELVNIGIPMPPDAQGIHHISDEELANARDISKVFPAVVSPYPYPNIVLVAHSEYDQKVLKERLDPAVPWIDTLKAAYRLWPDSPNHKNQTLRYFLKLKVPERLDGTPHRALPDAIVTGLILKEALKLATAEQLMAWTKEPCRYPKCPIGKKQGHAGKKWADVDAGFLGWMVREPDMDPDLKWNAEFELKRRERGPETIEAPPPPPTTNEERDAYMAAIPFVIKQAKTLKDLRNWYMEETPIREKWGIIKDTPELATILRLCQDQKTELLKTQNQAA